MSVKRPSFQFYPSDWLHDLSLRVCSVGARGLWIDMLCLMHQGAPYGYLKVGGKVIHLASLASVIGAPSADVQGWLAELEEAGVFSRDDDGCIYSRRMVRDELIREKRAAGGHLGGNPTLKGSPVVAQMVNLQSNLEPTPSSSSSSSSSTKETAAPKRPKKTPKTAMPNDFGISDGVRAWAKDKGFEPYLELHLEKFRTQVAATGATYANWDAAFRNCIGDDWGDVRKKATALGVAPKAAVPTCAGTDGTGVICGMPGRQSPLSGGKVLCLSCERKFDVRGPRNGVPDALKEITGLARRMTA